MSDKSLEQLNKNNLFRKIEFQATKSYNANKYLTGKATDAILVHCLFINDKFQLLICDALMQPINVEY